MSKRVLLTGATGFVGRHAVPSLVARGERVTLVTRKNIGPVSGNVTIVPIEDLRGDIDWSRHVDGVDAVVHLAALAHITSGIPESVYDEVNRKAAVRLARAASAAGARFIFASSIAAQSGPSSNRVQSESDQPSPTTPYGRSKLHAEQEIAEFSTDFVVLRPTLIYGAGVIGNMRRLMRLAMSRVPPPFALIRNQRSLLAIENMCEAIHFALNTDAARNNVFLVADQHPISTPDMVTQLRLGGGLRPTQLPIPPAALFSLLRLVGRGDIQEKVAGNLVASVAKLERFGFHWRANTRDALYTLGALSRGSGPLESRADVLEREAYVKKG